MPSRKKDPNKAGLEELRRLQAPGMGPPGALPGRLHGRYATATVAGVTLVLFEWEVNFTLETFDATAHGEYWKVMVPGDQSWVARARGYFTASSGTYLAGAAVAAGDPTAVAFTGYRDHTSTTAIWTGNGFITRANFSAPMAMVVQEMEIQGTGAPSAGT